MKSIIRRDIYQKIYSLLDDVTPIPSDCGLLCGSACCTCGDNADGKDMGIYLLPGEDKMFTKEEEWLKWTTEQAEDFDFPDSWFGKIYFMHCLNAPGCPRKNRPLQCRFFPLAPHFNEAGRLELIYYCRELPYLCPLITEKQPLEINFIRAVFAVWKKLIQDPLIQDLVEWDSSDRDPEAITVVYKEEEFYSLRDKYSSFVME